MKDLGWDQSVLDECIFFKKKKLTEKELDMPSSTENFPISGAIAVYVDDLIVCGDKSTTDKFYTEFEKSCTISKPEELKEGNNILDVYPIFRSYVGLMST